MLSLAPGLSFHPGFLSAEKQERLRDDVAALLAEAPLFCPRMPRSGRPFSVKMSNCGPLGWLSDERGYRYEPRHPDTGRPWPKMPDLVRSTWAQLAEGCGPPDACLINYYDGAARMGLHQDRDEEDFGAPVISLSLGDTCLFRYGGTTRQGRTASIDLASGDALVLGGDSRLAYHGVDRIKAGSSRLLPQGGRFNLTIRKVRR